MSWFIVNNATGMRLVEAQEFSSRAACESFIRKMDDDGDGPLWHAEHELGAMGPDDDFEDPPDRDE